MDYSKLPTIAIEGTIGELPEKLREQLKGTGAGLNFTAGELRAFLESSEAAQSEGVRVNINSMGGEVREGLEMFDALNAYKATGKIVATFGQRFDSIASVLMLAGTDGHRFAYSGASPLIHAAWIKAEELGDLNINAAVLNEIRDEFTDVDAQMLAIYATVSGRDSATRLRKLMHAETHLTDEQLLQLRFVNEILPAEGTAIKGRALAFSTRFINQNPETMGQENEKHAEGVSAVLAKFENMVNGFKALFSATAKAMRIELADGSEVFVDSEDGEVEGKTATLVVDGMPTDQPAPAGTHPLRDGRTITVGEGGVIESVAEAGPAPEEMEAALAAKDEEMKAALAAKDEEMKALKAENAKALAAVADVTKQMEAFKAEFKALSEVDGDPEGKAKGAEERSGFASTLKAMEVTEEEYKNMKPSERRKFSFRAERAVERNA